MRQTFEGDCVKVTGSIQKRNDIYQMMVRVIDEDGISHPKTKTTKIHATGKTQKEIDANRRRAEKMLSKWIAELEEANSLPSSRKLVAAIEDWYARYKDQVRLNTWESGKSYISKHLKPYFEPLGLKVEDVTIRHVQRYIDQKHKEGLTTGSIKKHIAILNGVFKEAVRFREIAVNPCTGVLYPKSEKYTPQFYTAEQAIRLINALGDDPVKPAVMLGLYLGLRRSEVAGLRWIDIDFDDEKVYIRNTVVRFSKIIEEEHTKSKASKRILALPSGLKSYLLDLKAEQERNRFLGGSDYHDSGHICQWPDGKQFDPNYISAHFKKFLTTNGLPVIRFHDLRHTAGSLLYNNGHTGKEVQEFLGHEDITTTLNIYVHTFDESKRKAASKMDVLLGGK